MLALGRKAGQTIHIGDDITIVVSAIRADGTVKLAIDAPRDVQILRGELYDQVRSTNLAAVSAGDDAEAQLARLLTPARTAR